MCKAQKQVILDQITKKGLLGGTTQMYCDICLECGEITRFFIKESTDKKWCKKPGSLFSK